MEGPTEELFQETFIEPSLGLDHTAVVGRNIKEPLIESLGSGKKVYKAPRCVSVNFVVGRLHTIAEEMGSSSIRAGTIAVGVARLLQFDQRIVAGPSIHCSRRISISMNHFLLLQKVRKAKVHFTSARF